MTMEQTPEAEASAGRRGDARLEPISLVDVVIDDEFWSARIRQIREVTLPVQFDHFRRVGHLEALSLSWHRSTPPHIFWDSDVAKWIEAASYLLASGADPELEAKVDLLIDLLARAQQPDGYLNSYFTVVDPTRRFTDLRDAHELYCAGHLIEAGVAHYTATGKRTLLDVVCRYADLIATVFGPGPGQLPGYDGHPEIELALVKLARATGERRYLDLARHFVDARGTRPFFFLDELARRGNGGWFEDEFPERAGHDAEHLDYMQAHQPVRRQREVVGHAVRATYLYCAMTDFADLDGDEDLREAVRGLWRHLTTRRMYITGGIGSLAHNEGFTEDFDLPTFTSYAETCAAIGLVFWAERMARLEDDGSYVDVLERALYNGVMAGIDQGGTHFFYDNPLATDGDRARVEWFGVACCPPNLARLFASIGRYAYAVAERELRVNLFVSGAARTRWDGEDVTLRVESAAPWSGAVRVVLDAARPVDGTVSVRLPRWAAGSRAWVDGEPVDLTAQVRAGVLRLDRRWRPGATISLELPMPARRWWADPRVESAAGRVAVVRGPLVYCAESADNPVPLDTLVLPRRARLDDAETPAGVVVHATGERETGDSELYRERAPERRAAPMTLVPYYRWNNRGPGQMRVWLRDGPGT